ncbi:uncharacterized membrane protein YgdD (TMEM256/DUF423 family) [Oceanihabitans sediminis]|uniref:DUF423 domain-containing protein n=1 Tax=Oceanihabitans sediminis TaxID=1812012 RepID=A0A368PC10_9FLAO|nr:DUF423 domain-containing protein [Oceanihabitans sediminis]RBP32111.1 uncharacterized membrane protein YgdD (TMEM256/DUF423 family) [Oceanihabitans sediminis]RCU58761.1 DUF423 domain-containing protein [Oceanihabitans sediminis]
MTQQVIIFTATLLGMLSVIFGAFGAHALKKILSSDQLQSFEVGVKYQMYHAIVLLVLGFNSDMVTSATYWCFTLGVLLFSFSIYGLVLSDAKGKKLRFLGPVTPIGGLLLVSGWFLLLLSAF